MIDWERVFSNALWLVGLALLLTVASYVSCAASESGRSSPPRALWRSFIGNGWARVGSLLFCAGMALTGQSSLEAILWCVLALYVLYGSWSAWRKPVVQEAPEEAPTGALPLDNRSVAACYLPQFVSRVAEWLIKTELLWLALLSPFFLFPAPDRVLPLIAIPLLWIARWVARGRFFPRTPLDVPILLMTVMVLVSLYATFDLSVSLQKIAYFLFGVALFYAVVEWAPDRVRLRWATGAFVLAGLGLAILGLLGTQWAAKIPVLDSISAQLPSLLRGLPGEEGGFNPTVVGGSLLWVLPLQMALFGWSLDGGFRVRPGLWALRLALLLATLVSTGMLLLAQSRSALIGLALGMALLLILARRRALPLMAVAVIVAVAGAIYVGPEKVASGYVALTGSAERGLASVTQREEIWSRALYGIEDFSFTGMGMGTFRRILPILYPLLSGEADITHAHDMFLQAGLDLGLPGLVGYIAMWLAATAMVIEAWRRSRGDTWRRAASAGIGACLLSSIPLGLTDVGMMVPKTGFLFWALLGLLAALWKRSRLALATAAGQPEVYEAEEAGGEKSKPAGEIESGMQTGKKEPVHA